MVLLIPSPACIEIDGIRRALGDHQLDRVAPHVTLVPPINLRDEQVADAMAIVEAAATGFAPFDLRIGALDQFDDAAPVRFLRVEPWEPVVGLHERCWTGVLDRPPEHPFHPHVTVDIAGGTTQGRDPALDVLDGYDVTVRIDRISLLEFEPSEAAWQVFVESRLRA